MKKSKKERLQNYLVFRRKMEIKDASFITEMGLLIIFIIFVSSSLLDESLYIEVVFLLFTILLWNINQVYIKKSPKYETGNSYVKRKWGTVGIGIYLYLILSMLLTVKIAKLYIDLFWVIFIIFFMIPTLSCRLIINKYWYKFDKNIYYEIDKRNPYQKKYLTESKYYWLDINNNE